MNSLETKYTVLDLFCGCGGMSLGFEKAGYHVLLGIDIWNDALETYKHNHKQSKTLCADMASLSPIQVEDLLGSKTVDVIIGGPPCQGFSIAGKRIVDDTRNKLYKGFVRMVEHFKPKAFVMENVPNILSIGDGAVKEAILSDFRNLGYQVVVQVMLASNYGVPQNRRRAVFVGLKSGETYDFPLPCDKPVVTSKEALSDLPESSLSEGAPYPNKPLSDYQRLIRDGSDGVYNHDITIHNERTKKIIAMVPDGGNYKDLPIELQQTRKVHIAWTRLNSKKPSFTIDCGHNHHFHYKYNRVPTLGLYYPKTEEAHGTMVYESETCKYLIEHHDFPTFFKNLCLNFQFPNGAKWINYVKEDVENHLNIKPFCYIVSLLFHAQLQENKVLLTKQEIGYYVLNNLDVLQGKVPCEVVYDRIMADRKNGIKREKLSGSKDWQHIKEQFNLLELANIIESDQTYLWLNPAEEKAISLFVEKNKSVEFDCYKYDFTSVDDRKALLNDWRAYFGTFNKELENIHTQFAKNVILFGKEEMKAQGGAFKSTVDLGDEGEALVFRIEQERVRNYKGRLVNKVLLLGKTKGLGYDISSIEADENPKKPEFARYIEVKSTKRVTVPSFDNNWGDSLNITAKEWIAAEQYGEYYNIYRVYFTKTKTIVVRIKNPYQKAEAGEIEVYPTIYQMNFDSNVIELRYDK